MMVRSGGIVLSAVVLLSALLGGCREVEQVPRQSQLFASASPESAPPAGAVIADIVGQAVCEDSSSPTDQLRAAAILDGLRKLALGKRSDQLNTTLDDTIIATAEWDGIQVLGVTIRHGGVVLLDSVVVQIINFAGDRPTSRRWKSFNMKLIEPSAGQDVKLSELIGALKAREIEATGGKAIAQGLWQESLAVRRWKRK